MSAPTPGPWAVCTDATGDTFIAAMTDSAETICDLGAAYDDEGQAQLESDARLISAAPDLLEALEWMVNSFAERQPNALMDRARAAIAKARGL